MNHFFAIVVALGLYSVSGFANPIQPHSCHSLGEISAYCTCDFLDPITGEEAFSGQVLCSVLKCSDYACGSEPEICQGARAVTCNLSNRSIAAGCKQTFPIVGPNLNPQVLCEGVLACLNDMSCVANYCDSTPVRYGWNLESVTVEDTKN